MLHSWTCTFAPNTPQKHKWRNVPTPVLAYMKATGHAHPSTLTHTYTATQPHIHAPTSTTKRNRQPILGRTRSRTVSSLGSANHHGHMVEMHGTLMQMCGNGHVFFQQTNSPTRETPVEHCDGLPRNARCAVFLKVASVLVPALCL